MFAWLWWSKKRKKKKNGSPKQSIWNEKRHPVRLWVYWKRRSKSMGGCWWSLRGRRNRRLSNGVREEDEAGRSRADCENADSADTFSRHLSNVSDEGCFLHLMGHTLTDWRTANTISHTSPQAALFLLSSLIFKGCRRIWSVTDRLTTP